MLNGHKTMQIELGALAKPLTEQLAGSGIDHKKLQVFDLDANAISRLYVRGLITESQATAARKKLLRTIQGAVTQTLREPLRNVAGTAEASTTPA